MSPRPMTRDEQAADVTALAAWLLSLTPEQYSERVDTLDGWCDVLGDSLPYVAPDDVDYTGLQGIANAVAALTTPDQDPDR